MEKIDIDFQYIQNKIVEILSSSKYCDKYISEYKLYNLFIKEINENLKLDNNEIYNLKIRFKIIITRLNNIFYFFNIINRDNILFISFTNNLEKNNDIDNNNVNNINYFSENILYEENNTEYLPCEVEIDNFMVDNFMVDNFLKDKNIEKYMIIKNYKNDTILHNIIRNKDLNRMKNLLSKFNFMLYEINDNGETGFDLNKSIDISNHLIKVSFIKLKFLENKIKRIDEDNNFNYCKIIKTLIYLIFFLLILYIVCIYLILN
jgi:hypothetical protein